MRRKPTRERLLTKLVAKLVFVDEEIDRLAREMWWLGIQKCVMAEAKYRFMIAVI